MKGLTKGEQASTTNPVLQLLVRVGGFLTDIYSGTFRIDDVVAPAGTVVARVASTPINTTTHRIGLGRYAVPSGATSSWVLGTHRVVYTYVLVAGGPTYTQVQEFELLSSSDWPVGYGFLTYLSTRKAWQDGVAAETVGAAEAPSATAHQVRLRRSGHRALLRAAVSLRQDQGLGHADAPP